MASQQDRVPDEDRKHYLLTRMRAGWAIVLIGFFLSPFWLALLMGAEGEILLATAAQSAIVILIGVTVVATGKLGGKSHL